MKREKAITTINEFPNEFNLDELLERLVFVEKVENGLKQIEENKTISHEDVKKMVKQW